MLVTSLEMLPCSVTVIACHYPLVYSTYPIAAWKVVASVVQLVCEIIVGSNISRLIH